MDVELAADHLVLGEGVAAHGDALDIGVRPVVEREHEIEELLLAVALRLACTVANGKPCWLTPSASASTDLSTAPAS